MVLFAKAAKGKGWTGRRPSRSPPRGGRRRRAARSGRSAVPV